MFLQADLRVTPEAALRPQDPFSSPFRLENDGALPIQQVTANCHIVKVLYTNGTEQSDNEQINYMDPVAEIGHGESHPLFCRQGFSVQNAMLMGEVYLEVRYRPWLVPIFRRKDYRFKTLPQSGGTLRWELVAR